MSGTSIEISSLKKSTEIVPQSTSVAIINMSEYSQDYGCELSRRVYVSSKIGLGLRVISAVGQGSTNSIVKVNESDFSPTVPVIKSSYIPAG